MKKSNLIWIILIILCVFSLIVFNFIKKKRPDISFEEKYPDYIEVINFYSKYPFEKKFIIKANENGLSGVYENKTDKEIIPPKYEHLEACGKEIFFYTNDDKLHRIIDHHNNIVFQAKYDGLNCKTKWCGFETVKKGKVGMVTFTGREILKPKYDEIQCQSKNKPFDDFYYIVKKKNKYAVFDYNGKKIVPFKKRKLQNAGDGDYFAFEKNNKMGIINTKGEIIVSPEYSKVNYGRMSLNDSDKYFVVCNYENSTSISNSTNKIFAERCGSIDISGEKHLPLIFMQDILRVSKDHYIIRDTQNNHKAFIVDKHGNKMHNKGYDIIFPLNEKYFRTSEYDNNQQKRLVSVIDINGTEVLSPSDSFNIIDNATDNGLIKIEKDGRYGVAFNNKIIALPIYNKVYFYRGHVMLLFEENGKKYYNVASFEDFANSEGKTVKKYLANRLKKTENKKCFKFVNDNGNDDVFCENKTDITEISGNQ